MAEVLTFQIEEDGETRTQSIPVDFTDVPVEVMAQIIANDPYGDMKAFTAGLLAYRLKVPLESALEMMKELEANGD